MTTPMTDPRPFADALRDWMTRRALTYEAAAAALGDDGHPVSRRAIAKWLAGEPPRYERQTRALMTLIDEGRA